VIKVSGLLHNRVAYSEAINHYIDLTPEEEADKVQFHSASFHTGKLQSKTGRPSKKERRELGDLLSPMSTGESPLPPGEA
jgi:ribosome-associated heat shock protein Hsp15